MGRQVDPIAVLASRQAAPPKLFDCRVMASSAFSRAGQRWRSSGLAARGSARANLRSCARRRAAARAMLATALAFAIDGCGGADVAAPLRQGNPEFEGPPFYEGELDQREAPTASAIPGEFVDGQTTPKPRDRNPDPCIIDEVEAELVTQPVDIILLLDNSGSMADELEAVEANINVNFASILTSSEVDYRVILISRHRHDPRDESEESSTSICVSSPLSALSDCTAAPEPGLSDRFFQYSTKLESTDSLDVMLDTYAPPFDGSEREDKFERAPLGWSQWLRAHTKKVFLEMTDDNEDMSVDAFLDQLATTAPDHFGSDDPQHTFVFHSIVGLAEKPDPTEAYYPDEPIQPATCTGNANVVQNAGSTYQQLSQMTGGLRFPLCQFGAYDVVFERIAEDVVLTSSIACDFPIPAAPPGLDLDLENVAIQYDSSGGVAAVRFRQAAGFSSCQPGAFYIEHNRLNLCPTSCDAIRADPAARLAVLFTCESQLIVPR
jgi:hypothetical protein